MYFTKIKEEGREVNTCSCRSLSVTLADDLVVASREICRVRVNVMRRKLEGKLTSNHQVQQHDELLESSTINTGRIQIITCCISRRKK